MALKDKSHETLKHHVDQVDCAIGCQDQQRPKNHNLLYALKTKRHKAVLNHIVFLENQGLHKIETLT